MSLKFRRGTKISLQNEEMFKVSMPILEYLVYEEPRFTTPE